MTKRRLTPSRGWSAIFTSKAFYRDIIVVGIGVVLALGAEQGASWIGWKLEVREFRAALDQELRYNFGGYQDRIEQSQCIKARLDQLDKWYERSRAGERLGLASQIVRHQPIAPRNSVWESRTPGVVGHLGLQQRIDYAYYYDALKTYGELARRERDSWTSLMDYSGAQDLDRSDLARLRGLIDGARLNNQLINDNWKPLSGRAEKNGFRGRLEPGEMPWDKSLCNPLELRPI